MRLNSLFWKIFSAFFLANLLAMGLTTYIALEASNSDFVQKNHRELQSDITNIIDRYESVGEVRLAPYAKRIKSIQHRVEVYTESGEHVFGRIAESPKKEVLEFEVQSSSTQKNYRVVSSQPKFTKGFMRLRGFIQSVRFVLLLLASAAVSFVLSLLIVRPLKQLGLHARNLAEGNMQSRLGQQLLARKDEIGDLSHELNDMAHQLDTLINSKHQLLHDVSHELRAPLARLQAASGLLGQEHTDNKAVKRIEKECHRMNGLIQDILDYSRIQDSPEKNTSFNLSALLKESVDNVQYEYPQHPIQFLSLPNTAMIEACADKLQSALENVLSNACKYTAQGTGVDVELLQENNSWHIRIRDHGSGVKSSDLNRLATPFYRAENVMHGDGFGLGLSIVQKVVAQHQGDLVIDNHPEGGLQLSMFLPLTQS